MAERKKRRQHRHQKPRPQPAVPAPQPAPQPTPLSIDGFGLRDIQRDASGFILSAKTVEFTAEDHGEVLVLRSAGAPPFVIGWGLVEAIARAHSRRDGLVGRLWSDVQGLDGMAKLNRMQIRELEDRVAALQPWWRRLWRWMRRAG